MKVEGPRPVRPGAVRRGGAGGARQGDFASHIPQAGDPRGAAVGGASRVGPVDALLALQEVTERGARPGRRHAEAVLDRLEAIRDGLLTGVIPPARLRELADELARRPRTLEDPRLAELLDEIELRARVELAKLERPGG